jgi:GTP-binding protein EngB required for normal cell division
MHRRAFYFARGIPLFWRHQQQRSFTFGPTSLAKFPFRLALGTVTATLGYATYKVGEAKNWLNEKVDLFWNLIPSPKERTISNSSSSSNSTNKRDKPNSSANNSASKTSTLSAVLIKRMIEVRNLLKIADSSTLTLPTIVVIGSQSSGKSSVLEAIVGREFLPKGSNMTTKRPLEITLVHLDDATCKDYAIFPQLGTAPIEDFDQVKRMLSELNNAVPPAAWVSDTPVELLIYSQNVPDLSLVDLPGYIAVTNRNQPPELREKINQLCHGYISRKPENVILAVSAADVDLANSQALKASRSVDPLGQRTIGVITKMDLVPPETGISLLASEDYPLKLGYIGVVCGTVGALEKESKVFQGWDSKFSCCVGVPALQNRLLDALERVMSDSLQGALKRVEEQLEDVSYRFKVLYNDKPISIEGYIAFLSNTLKDRLRDLSGKFTRQRIESEIEQQLQSTLIDLLWQSFWNTATANNTPSTTLINVASMLTKCGVGRIATGTVLQQLVQELKSIGQVAPLSLHSGIMDSLVDIEGGAAQGGRLLKERVQVATHQIENAIKPLKSQPEYTPTEWERARERAISMVKREIAQREAKTRLIVRRFGQRRLFATVQQMMLETGAAGEKVYSPNVTKEFSIDSHSLREKAEEVVLLNHQLIVLRSRLALLQSAPCKVPLAFIKSNPFNRLMFWNTSFKESTISNQPMLYEHTPERGLVIQSDPCQYNCPEIYLHVLLGKLTKLSSSLVHFEVIQDYLNPCPTDYSDRYSSLQTGTSFFSHLLALGHGTAGGGGVGDRAKLKEFVKQNPAIREHLELQERLEVLTVARAKLKGLLQQHQVDGGSTGIA